MTHKKIILPISLGLISAAIGASLSMNALSVNASSDDWGLLAGQPLTLEDVEGGAKIENTSGYGNRAYYKDKVKVDGLSFDWKVDNLVEGDCRGFAFHAGGDPWSYYTEQPSCVFTAWQIFTQSRFYIGTTHDYNVAPINYSDMEKTKAGFSSAGGHLIMNRSQDYTLNFAFEKVNDTWYKVTIKGDGVTIWGSPNYASDTKTNSAVSYITADDLKVDAEGKAYLITVAMSKHGDLSDAVYFLNMRYETGIEAVAPNKVAYKINEDLDLEGLKVSKVYKNGDKVDVDLKDVTVSGYDKTVYGKQTVKVSALGYETSFEVEVLNPVTKVELSGTPKVDYTYGESLDLSTFKLLKTFENGDTAEAEVTEDMIKGFDKSVVGKQNIAISCDGFIVEVSVEVKDVVTSIAMKSLPTKVEYEIGEELNVAGGMIEVTYASGAKKVTDLTKEMVKDFDSSEAGEVTLDVEYNGFHTSFDITIKAAPTPVEPDKPAEGNGCGGSIIAASGILSVLALAGVGLVSYKKRH